MDILPGFKLCRKGLHQYSVDKRTCPECARASWRKYASKNKSKKKNYQKEWYKKNKEQKDVSNKRWRQKNKNRVSCYQKEWYQLNKDKRRAVGKKWEQNNKNKVNASKAKRRALEKQAMPTWSDPQAIKNIYKKALEATKKTGIKHEVDHIYPLQSKYMCGLHVETNLQILTKSENSAKSNRTWPGQLECQKE